MAVSPFSFPTVLPMADSLAKSSTRVDSGTFSAGSEDAAGLRARAEAFGLDAVETLADVSYPAEFLGGISEAWARKNGALPVSLAGEPVLLTVRPDCLETLQQAQLMTGGALRPVLVEAALLETAIVAGFQGGGVASAPAASGGKVQGTAEATHAADGATVDLLSGGDAAPAVGALNAVLLDAIRRGASDIHFEPWSGGLRVRFRIDGGLYEQPAPARELADAVVSRLKVMARMDIADRRLPQDGMAQVRMGGRVVDLRVSTVPVSDGERVVLRILDRDNAWLPLADLGMGREILEPFSALLARPHGLVVVSGPTGSGKTTTLYSALSTLDSARRNILTVEDPVEYRLPAIGQIQVKPKIGLTFAAGLRHILRQDPDVILVGETRDSETAEIAVRAALTGHLVFTTLHTNDASSAVARLADMGVEPYLLASCLRGVLAQRLVRRLCPNCRKPAAVADVRKRFLDGASAALIDALPQDARLFEAGGCAECLEGYRGRIGLFEYMGVGEQVSESIRRGELDAAALRAAAEAEGRFESLAKDAVRKLATGVTDMREALGAVQ